MRNLTSSTLQKRHVSDKAYFRPQLLSRRQITCSGIAQLLDSISVSHAIFSLLKPLILSHNPLRVGVQPKLKHFNKTLRFGDCKSNSRNRSKNKKQKTKLHEQHDFHSVHSSYTYRKPCAHAVLLRPFVPPDKFIVA